MDTVASRDLRNHTADVLARVSAGETVAVTVRGEVVAELSPPGDRRPLFFTPLDFPRVMRTQADPQLRAELKDLAGETTDDLGDPWQ